MSMKSHSENAIAVWALGIALIVAEFWEIPKGSHDVVVALGSGLLGFVAKSFLGPAAPAAEGASS